MAYCVPRPLANKFKEYLKSGKITPDKLVSMSSAERRELFSEIVGVEDAKEMNAALESKLILKDQQRGMITWLKQTAGLTPEARRDMISRIEKMDSVLQPENSVDQLPKNPSYNAQPHDCLEQPSPVSRWSATVK